MKISNKNRADIKKKQDKLFKKFLDEANPMVTVKVEPEVKESHCPPLFKFGGIVAGLFILILILV